jgi:hypothetical protein
MEVTPKLAQRFHASPWNAGAPVPSLAQQAHVHERRIASTQPCTLTDPPAPAELDILTLSTRRMRYG